jgi:hypothetical protein
VEGVPGGGGAGEWGAERAMGLRLRQAARGGRRRGSGAAGRPRSAGAGGGTAARGPDAPPLPTKNPHVGATDLRQLATLASILKGGGRPSGPGPSRRVRTAVMHLTAAESLASRAAPGAPYGETSRLGRSRPAAAPAGGSGEGGEGVVARGRRAQERGAQAAGGGHGHGRRAWGRGGVRRALAPAAPSPSSAAQQAATSSAAASGLSIRRAISRGRWSPRGGAPARRAEIGVGQCPRRARG